MNITSFVVQGRDQALLYGDYSTYHRQLAKRLLSARKKLGIVTKNRGKFQNRGLAISEAVSSTNDERAWAQAMSIKASRTAAKKDIAGRARSHIVSRLTKAAKTAEVLVDALSTSASGASIVDVLEAKSYASLMRGAMFFEKKNWELCLENYAVARIVYSALASLGQGDLFKDLLSETIDPSIRYAAYQLKTPRSVPIASIAKNSFPRSDASLVREIDRIDSSILAQGGDSSASGGNADNTPRTITWRSREVQIEDARISLAWASVQTAKTRLADNIAQSTDQQPHKLAAHYDEVLMATQDAVDAAKQSIDELKAEGVAQSDARMQRLQITRTAVNYEMISWRIGRNRVLTGQHDGAPEEYTQLRRKKAKATASGDADAQQNKARELPPSKKLAKLKEKVALYDGTLQNLESVKELPGVAADESLATSICGCAKYFEALKCLSIARSHAILGNALNTLALINHAYSMVQEASSKIPPQTDNHHQRPLSIDVHPEAVRYLEKLVNGELQRYRAIVHLHNLRDAERAEADAEEPIEPPLIKRLHVYPRRINPRKIVEFPPKMELIPLKPIFLDVAWNYIDYPSRKYAEGASGSAPRGSTADQPAAQGDQTKKKGWFGFGR
ncbi:hypothetical protein UVI_02036940 [Ustilaginoidea virens]|uniref:Signal recognition particle subunit SRP68 n=1 Tax=Ustilaginoidea virens TaxID=1159556 RepID=A0A1B5L3V9_USTVR|nr:hypothetical protein UVI_02036940 [Ustilaginoidea virens]